MILEQIRYIVTGKRCQVVRAADLAHDLYMVEQDKTRDALRDLMMEAVALHNERVIADYPAVC